jgi:uncharacterized protein (DUF2147 family)
MKNILAGVIIIFAAALFPGASLKAEDSLAGTWKTIADKGPDKGKETSHIEIFENSGLFFAKVTKLLIKPQETLCDKCKGDLYNKPIVGMIFMKNMKKTGKTDKDFGDEYAGGTIMEPDSGNTYRSKLWLKGNVLVVRGYVAFFYRTQRWFKIK